MDATFERKLRAAVSAGWRVLVIEVVALTIVWVFYLAILGAHPSVMLALSGPDVTWSTLETISLQAIAAFKVALWLQAAILGWAALWGAALRKLDAESAEGRSRSASSREGAAAQRPLSAPSSR
jgi:hypothetical protein